MNKLKKKAIVFLGIIILLLLIFSDKVDAASASITSSQTVTQGSSVTVTGSVTAGAWNMVLAGAGQSKGLVGQTTTTGSATASTNITFTATEIGTYTFTFTGDITDYDTDETTYPSKTCTITVVASSSSSSSSSSTSSSSVSTSSSSSNTSTTTSSSSSTTSTSSSAPTLTNLGITPYDFSGFKSYTTSYSVTVPNECSSVTIYANAASGNTITGTGTVTLSEGTNKYIVTVSNSNGSTSYTLSIIRQTLDGDDVANSIEGEETEESEGIGLADLSIEGYELDPEFNISTYEYTVIVDDELTLLDLEEIKSKITATTNTDSVYTEITAEISEDGVATIKIVVKDDEKEYATYVIYFEQEETEIASVAGTTTYSNSSDEWIDIEYFTRKVYLITGCLAICVVIAMFYAISSYKKTKYIEKYIIGSDVTEDEEDNFDELIKDFKENEIIEDEDKIEDSKIPEMATAASDSEEISEGVEKTNSDLTSTKYITEKEDDELKDSRAYKKPRRGFSSGGKH